MHCLYLSKEWALFISTCLTRDSRMFLVKRAYCSLLRFCFWLATSEKHLKSLKNGILLCTTEGEVCWHALCGDLWSKGWTYRCLRCLWACIPDRGRLAFVSFAFRGSGTICWVERGCNRERIFFFLLFCFPVLYTDLLLVRVCIWDEHVQISALKWEGKKVWILDLNAAVSSGHRSSWNVCLLYSCSVFSIRNCFVNNPKQR